MLPPPAEYQYLWDISSGKVPSGSTVRTFGRLNCYDFTQSEAVLTAHHSTGQHKLQVNTRFVEPFSPRLGSHYMALGELESGDDTHVVLCARLLTCIEGADVSLLQNAIEEQRKYFLER
ncbi:PREDICTED: CST complex subunit TEN1 isoform X1 [Nanorana parkeri]|uniref:CST complex subunit TEN1 isoform X1 n=1 Tax=Nanorana parkeri TaxID=125878 RepID=UPI0008545703|nr:PREDICTED: CST complex subunit TEN1 isoform X1 [Nanorana parkeri]